MSTMKRSTMNWREKNRDRLVAYSKNYYWQNRERILKSKTKGLSEAEVAESRRLGCIKMRASLSPEKKANNEAKRIANQLSKKERHAQARVWSLINPSGEIFFFRNLSAFVRDNADRFSTEVLGGRSLDTIIANLQRLSPRAKVNTETAYGWRWHIHGKEPESYLGILSSA